MTKTAPSISKILQILRNGTITQEQTSVLTYICSNIGKENLSQTINEVQYVELCKLLLALLARPDKDEMVEHMEKKSADAEMTLHSVLEITNDHVNCFKMLSDIERKDRMRVLECLNHHEIRILARIIQDPMAIDVISDCLQMVQPSKMKWMAADACTDNIQPLIEAETQTLSDEQEIEEQLICHTLTMLCRLYEYASISSSDMTIERIHPLLFERVISLAYMGHKRQRTSALKLLNEALNTNLISYIKDKYSSLWVQYKNTLQNTYCLRMSLLVKAADHDWANQWCLSIKMLGIDLHRGAELINNLLSVEEKAFKSTDMTVRKDAFESWKHLVDNFALNTAELTSLRRIKLLCIPLNAKNSKIEMVAIAKLETWWHLIVKLYSNVDKSVNQVIEQFLNFCFGPLGDTPLLSKKCDVVASPGKRFTVTKLMAIDALLQLLVQKPCDRHRIPCFIKDRLSNSLPNAIFQASHKSLFHSVGEAVLLINELGEGELNNRKELNEILWANLMMYIQQSSAEYKVNMYKELILILGEVMSHIVDSPLIIGLLLDVIIAQFVNTRQHLIYHDTTLMDLLLKLLSPGISRSADKKYLNDLTHLICHAIKPQDTKLYHYNTLPFIKAALSKMELLMEHEVNLCVFELWCTFAEIVIKYIEQNQQINEGTAMNHNFETVQLLIIFPIQNIFWYNPGPTTKIGKLWRELYKQFDMQTDLIATVKPNEILHNITTKMESYIFRDKRCYRIIAHCFDALLSTINYEIFLSENRVPPLIKLFRDVAILALTEMAVLEIELSLKATSSFLITVYGLNQKCALIYLDILKPSIEFMLKIENIESVEKEIVNTWETVVIIFRGLTKLLTREFIMSYQTAILLALRHKSRDISAQATTLIYLKSDLGEEAKNSLDEIEKILHKIPGVETNSVQKKIEDTTKHMKIAGSFLNRKILNPKTVITMKKDCEAKKTRVPSPLPPSESNSQDYVLIKTDAKLDINRLTEHQKESLKRRRDDIPALYNDLSQSESRNTQQLEDWFKNTSEVFDGERNVNENADNKIEVDGEANKENDLSSCVGTIDSNEKLNDWTTSKDVGEEKSKIEISKNDANTQMTILADDENNLPDVQVDVEITDEHVPQTIAKKLNFDSHEQFPDENEDVNSNAECFSRLDAEESHTPREPKIVPEHCPKLSLSSSRSTDDLDSQSLESLHTTRRGRSRGKPVRVNKGSFRSTIRSSNGDDHSQSNLKRKAALDSESEGFTANKRRRYSTIPQSSSDTTSDSESINSIEGENHMATLPDVDLPKRTKKEMSRLQINMVFNSRMPSKLRSKPVDDYVYGSNSKRQKNKTSEKSACLSSCSQELVKKRKRRGTRSLPEIGIDPLKTTQAQLLEGNGINSRLEADDEIKVHAGDRTTTKDISGSLEATEMYANSNSDQYEQITDGCDNSVASDKDNFIRNLPTNDNNCKTDCIDEEEEVIESSQKTNSVLTSPHRRSHDERCTTIVPSKKTSPKKQIVHVDPDTLPNCNVITKETENTQKSPHEKTNVAINAGFNFSSPKTVKRLSKTKVFTPQGRAAHMLGLVTKLAIVEKKESIDNIRYSEDEIGRKLKFPKDLEGDGASMRKERVLILKEPDRIGSPSGSRQEKIFNNMKSKDYISSPPSKLFTNLKNNGEKVSPKFEKTILTESTKTSDENHDTENSISSERDELPILEWSNANPPSLTASPSVSILKRQRQIMSDIDNDTSSKKKRVSFTDPPVSREMGYEVISGLSPIKMNKFGQPRSLLGRKDTPIKSKQSRFRTIPIDVEKSDQLSSAKSNASISSDINEIDHGEIGPPIKKTMNFEESFDDCDRIGTNVANSRDDETNNTPGKNVYIENSSIASPMAGEKQTGSPSTRGEFVLQTHYPKNFYHNEENKRVDHELRMNESAASSELQAEDCIHSAKFNITDDPTIARILNDSGGSCKSNDLEDTVDIQNVSNLNSTANSDELFDAKLARTSTQIVAMTAMAQSDTLPVTDSMFLSQAMSQDSLATQQSLAESIPHTMDMTSPIYPTLLNCNDPIDAIVNDLVNPMWTQNLSKYFAARNINTIADLAQLSEREVTRFPVKGSPKANYIKQVLDKFALSHVSLLKDETAKKAVATTSKAVCSTPCMNEKSPGIVDETIELISDFNDDCDDNNVTADITATSVSPVNSSLTGNAIAEQHDEIATEFLQKQMESIRSNDFGSIIIDTSIAPPSPNTTAVHQTERLNAPLPVMMPNTPISDSVDHHMPTSATKLEGLQINLEKLMDEIDPNLLLQCAMKRNTPEDIVAQYKMKMKYKSETEFAKETLRMLGLEMCTETELKNACREYGLTKVLGRLPAIFNTDNQFFTKVLNTYRMKITADDCINGLDLNQLKKAICNKCSSSELCDMLSTVLTNEERNYINTPITEVSSLNAMLKRMPMDSIISHTVANDELIPSSFVLEIALQNNNSDTITHALDAQFPNIVENIMNRNMSAGKVISYMNKSQLSKDKLLDIYRAVCDKLSPNQLLDAHNEVMKKKLSFLDNNEQQ